MKQFTYLALGDSYTIGEQVKITDSFPYQIVQQLRRLHTQQSQCYFAAPEIVAVTGFTSGELIAEMDRLLLTGIYDFVTLLIGVNNQYRGQPVGVFEAELDLLIQRAIQFAGNKRSQVILFSIPDWGVTPFAAERDQQAIAAEIDLFNQVCMKMASVSGINFINITAAQREDGNNSEFLAADQLHPSAREYSKWATAAAKLFTENIRYKVTPQQL